MLKIFNDLQLFIEDNYRQINVREYARLSGISPPSASTLLRHLEKEGLLKSEKYLNFILYSSARESQVFFYISRIYWLMKLKRAGILDYLEKGLLNPLVILFGSLSKAEAKNDSDIDLAIFSASEKKIDLSKFEKKLSRKIEIFQFRKISEIKAEELISNIRNGFILLGSW